MGLGKDVESSLLNNHNEFSPATLKDAAVPTFHDAPCSLWKQPWSENQLHKSQRFLQAAPVK